MTQMAHDMDRNIKEKNMIFVKKIKLKKKVVLGLGLYVV